MLEFELVPLSMDVITAAFLIFILRVIGVTLATLRVLIMLRGRKLLAATMGFFEVLVYVIAIGAVVNNLSNVWNLLGYCLGFSVGTLAGMALEERLALGYASIRVVSRYKAQQVADEIREAGYGATIEWGQGRSGVVGQVLITVNRRDIEAVLKLVDQADEQAFVTVEETRAIRRGFMRIARHER